jgi:hypothetical protein
MGNLLFMFERVREDGWNDGDFSKAGRLNDTGSIVTEAPRHRGICRHTSSCELPCNHFVMDGEK